jgi:hypothetical protein
VDRSNGGCDGTRSTELLRGCRCILKCCWLGIFGVIIAHAAGRDTQRTAPHAERAPHQGAQQGTMEPEARLCLPMQASRRRGYSVTAEGCREGRYELGDGASGHGSARQDVQASHSCAVCIHKGGIMRIGAASASAWLKRTSAKIRYWTARQSRAHAARQQTSSSGPRRCGRELREQRRRQDGIKNSRTARLRSLQAS